MRWPLLSAIFVCPFISSLAFPQERLAFSAFLFISILLWYSRKGAQGCPTKPVCAAMLLFLCAVTASLCAARFTSCGLREALDFFLGAGVFFCGAKASRDERRLLALSMSIAAIMIGGYAIYQYFWGIPALSRYVQSQGMVDPFLLDQLRQKRVFSPFMTPNALGGYLAMILPLALGQYQVRRLAVLAAGGLLLTRSAGAIASAILAGAGYLFMGGRAGKGLRIAAAAAICLGIIGVAGREFSSPRHQAPSYSAGKRMEYWKDTVKTAASHPWQGVGLARRTQAGSRYSHNSYLQLWAETGVAGIIPFLLLVGMAGSAGIRSLRGAPQNRGEVSLLLCAAGIFLLHNAVDFNFFLPEVSISWWLILGMLWKASTEHTPTAAAVPSPAA